MTRVLIVYDSEDQRAFEHVKKALDAFQEQQVVESVATLALDTLDFGTPGVIDARLAGHDVYIVLRSQHLAAGSGYLDLLLTLGRYRNQLDALLVLVAIERISEAGSLLSGFTILPEGGRPVVDHDDQEALWPRLVWALRSEIKLWQGSGHLESCNIENFTVFEKVSLEFVQGLNIVTGVNGTGKTHLLKLLYATVSPPGEMPGSMRKALGVESTDSVSTRTTWRMFQFMSKLRSVFRPAEFNAGHLVRAGSGEIGQVDVRSVNETIRLTVQKSENPQGTTGGTGDVSSGGNALFIPSREVLAMYEGFVSAYEKRELSFDETYYDLCKALEASQLRNKGGQEMGPILEALEHAFGGEVRLSGNRFYVRSPSGELEAHLLAEGLRKLAVLAHLIMNGSLTQETILFWDEPEANLHPRLVVALAPILRQLAHTGVQVFLATHDYLLVREFSLAAEYRTEPAVPMRFFSLFRQEEGGPVEVEAADVFTDLEHNPLLEEFSAHYEREQALFYGDEREETPA